VVVKDGAVTCDGCGAAIAHVRPDAAVGWEHLHNLCPTCFQARAKQAV
jgi:hypothetical protein